MAKDKPTNEEKVNPEAEAPIEAPKKPQAVIKVVAIPLDEEYVEPEGWILKEIHSVDVSEGKFFGVLVKIQEMPSAKSGMRMGPRIPLKKER